MIMSVDISNIHLADDCVVIAIFFKNIWARFHTDIRNQNSRIFRNSISVFIGVFHVK